VVGSGEGSVASALGPLEGAGLGEKVGPDVDGAGLGPSVGEFEGEKVGPDVVGSTVGSVFGALGLAESEALGGGDVVAVWLGAGLSVGPLVVD
jgi:hypothetical protein